MKGMSRYKRLLEPFQTGSLTLRNRIVMPPMTTNFASKEGFVTDRLVAYYEERARGGVGLIIVEPAFVSLEGRMTSYQISAADDECLVGLTRLTHAIHGCGAKAFLQIHHAGRASTSRITGVQPVAPSAVPAPRCEMPRSLTEDEISNLVMLFVNASRRAQQAGFDGVELYAAHMGLLAQFLSSTSNKRADRYGGDIKNRARLLVEIIRAIKVSLGQGYPLSCRINAIEYGAPEGVTLEESRQIAAMAQQAGADIVDVSAYGIGRYAHLAPQPPGRGAFLPLAEALKRAVSVPVIAVGRIEPESGERAIEEHKADLVAIGRGLIADPGLPLKAASGQLDEIVPCIGCLGCIDYILFRDEPMRCTVNPAAGQERQAAVRLAQKAKEVVVVGGGPAGMEAARVLAARGHKVTLFEQSDKLGGQLLSACQAPGKADISDLVRYLTNQVKRRGVNVKLGKEATADEIKCVEPDALVLATGAQPIVPDIPGVGRRSVVLAQDVLEGKVQVGKKVVVVGAELVGCEVADFLSEQGREVTVVRRGPRVATKMMPLLRRALLDRLTIKGVIVLTDVKHEGITADGSVIISREGEKRVLEADTVVLAAGSRPRSELYEVLKGKVSEIYNVGDSVRPRRIMDAITEAYDVAKGI